MLRRLLREIKASMGIYEPRPEDGYVYGVLAEYPDPGALMHAAEAVREAGLPERIGLRLRNGR